MQGNFIVTAMNVTNNNQEMLTKSNLMEKRIGSTALMGLIIDKTLYIANVGDTRAVISNNGKSTRISLDHKPLDISERNRIRDLGGT